MSYEYNQDTQIFDLPNPFKVENIFLAINGGVFVATGVFILWQIKNHFQHTGVWLILLTLSLAILTLGLGGLWLKRCLSQLRYFFGITRPFGLAPQIKEGEQGKSTHSDQLKEILRHQTLGFKEPQSSLEGLLHALLPKLIYAPSPIKGLATKQFRNALTMAILFLTLTITLAIATASSKVVTYIGLGFLLYAGYVIGISKDGARLTHKERTRELSLVNFVALVTFMIIGPVLLGAISSYLPPLRHYSPYPQVFILLLGALTCYAIYFWGITQHLNTAPQTFVKHIQEAWHLNCHPNQLLGELDRTFRNQWAHNAPNRIYSKLEPHVDLNQKTGKFAGESLQETQPEPIYTEETSLQAAWASARNRPLLVLSFVSSIMGLLGAYYITSFSQAVFNPAPQVALHTLSLSISFTVLAILSMQMAHSLWQRIDFTSRLTLLEVDGQYTAANVQQGRIMQDHLNTSSSMVKTESMTFRMWSTTLHTVIFGKNAPRYIISMNDESDYLHQLKDHLQRFVKEQSILIAPTSIQDLKRQAHTDVFNTRLPQEAAHTMAIPQDIAHHLNLMPSFNLPIPPESEPSYLDILPAPTTLKDAATPAPSYAASTSAYCTQCGKACQSSDKFCGGCGHKM